MVHLAAFRLPSTLSIDCSESVASRTTNQDAVGMQVVVEFYAGACAMLNTSSPRVRS